jgi:hypothetical protein
MDMSQPLFVTSQDGSIIVPLTSNAYILDQIETLLR